MFFTRLVVSARCRDGRGSEVQSRFCRDAKPGIGTRIVLLFRRSRRSSVSRADELRGGSKLLAIWIWGTGCGAFIFGTPEGEKIKGSPRLSRQGAYSYLVFFVLDVPRKRDRERVGELEDLIGF